MPFALPAVALSLAAGRLFSGWDAAWSAAIGAAVVFANFAVHGLSLARAARVSIVALGATAMVGFVVRLGVIVALMAGLRQLAFFSPLAFGLAVVPWTVLLLAYELKLYARGVGRDLVLTPTEGRG
jgi:hypothetical protein